VADLVPAEDIEQIVGVQRHTSEHFGRAVSGEERFYILHSRACRNSGIDLRECPFSVALDRGIDPAEWIPDVPTMLDLVDGRLVDADTLGRSAMHAVIADACAHRATQTHAGITTCLTCMVIVELPDGGA
jgi:hypothetical protein